MRAHNESETSQLQVKHKDGLLLFKGYESLFDQMFEKNLTGHPQSAKPRRLFNLRLARKLLDESLSGLWSGEPELAKECLIRSVKRSPRILGPTMSRPHIGVKMGILALAPMVAGQLFSHAGPEEYKKNARGRRP